MIDWLKGPTTCYLEEAIILIYHLIVDMSEWNKLENGKVKELHDDVEENTIGLTWLELAMDTIGQYES